jgi:hypothetical protein
MESKILHWDLLILWDKKLIEAGILLCVWDTVRANQIAILCNVGLSAIWQARPAHAASWFPGIDGWVLYDWGYTLDRDIQASRTVSHSDSIGEIATIYP